MNKIKQYILRYVLILFSAAPLLVHGAGSDEILNVSYDPTREFYRDYNELFGKYWEKETGRKVNVKQSHGGSGKQARAVIDGLKADVVTLALAYDIDEISAKSKLLEPGWQKNLPQNSSPYASTIVFLVRKGNPKGIRDWGDLIKPGVEVITPNPKTSGGARWNHLAAWGYVLNRELGDLNKINNPANAGEVKAAEKKAQEFITELYKHVPVLDSGARGATTTFAQRGIGDVLLAWENEAFLSVNQLGADKFDIVAPPISILAEPPVAIVDKVVDKRGTRKVAEAYLKYLYSPEAQQLAAKHYYRPVNPEKADPVDIARFAKSKLFTIDQVFGGWLKAQKEHFSDGGIFDKVYQPGKSG
jgi:sulfate transport system substrate-binding protein